VTKVISIRVPVGLATEVRSVARERQISISGFVGWVLGIALSDGLGVSQLRDSQEPLNDKLDLRLSSECAQKLRLACRQTRITPSVYIRTLLNAGLTRRVTLKLQGGRYTLVANHDQN